MDQVTTDDRHKEQRILAAIVFTDVVGFSKLTATNEARVYSSLQRDMDVITSLCRNHSGQVLNKMGDGMLLCFTSAVDAMSCAVEIQRTLYAQAQTLPASDVLHHRIGVHLGDIIMSGDNVFGDGVNIASRLQAEAKPDGICFSKTVHEVVKNKLKLDAQYMAPRQLKNIGRVEIWQVPPIEEARQKAMQALIAAPLENQPERVEARGIRAISLVVAAFLCLGAIVFLVKIAMNRGIPSGYKPGTVKNDPNAPVNNWARNAHNSDKPADPPSIPVATNAPVDLPTKLDSLKKSYAFDQAAAFLQGDGKALPDAAVLSQTYLDLAQMRQWIDSEMDTATFQNPVKVSLPINGSSTPVTAYRSTTRSSYTIYTDATGQSQVIQFADLSPAGIAALGAALIDHPITQAQPNAQMWLGEFQKLYPQ